MYMHSSRCKNPVVKSGCRHVPSNTGTDLLSCVQNENSEQTMQIKFYLCKFLRTTYIYTLYHFQVSLNVKYGIINLKDHISSKSHPAVFIPDAEIGDILPDNSFQIFFGKKISL